MSNFNDIVSILDSLNQESALSFYLPSLKREVKFKSISTGQQKTLLKASVDNPVFQTRFIIAVYNIIIENCQEKEIVNSLNIIDVLSILLQYRVSLYGSKFIVKNNDKNIHVELQTCIDRIKTITLPEAGKFEDGPISIVVGLPTLLDQYQLEKQVREKSLSDKDLINLNNINIGDTIGDAFIGEVSKYIKDITIVKEGNPYSLNYKDLSFNKKFAVLEKIPTATVKQLLTYIVKVTALQREITQVEGLEENTNKPELVNVPLDSGLFALE